MKCIKCGFEARGSFCPMCGTKFPEDINTTPDKSPQIGIISSEDGPTAIYTNTEFNPYQQTNQSAPVIPQSIPTPNQYAPYEPQMPQPQKSGKTLPIVLSIIVSIIIITGILVNILSSVLFNSEYISEPIDDNDNSSYEELDTNEDTTIYSINKPVQCKYGNITLKGIEVTKESFEFNEDYKECKLTFELENPTNKAIELSVPTIQLCHTGDDYYEDCFEWLYDDYESANEDYSLTLGANETKTFVSYYKVPNYVNDFSILFELFDFDCESNFICYFEASLANTETTTQKEN